MNPEFKALADDIYRGKVLRARQLTAEQRLADCFMLTDLAFGRMRDGIRADHPGAGDEEVERLLGEHMTKLRRLSEWGIFQPVGTP